jgi:hypothetical protein
MNKIEPIEGKKPSFSLAHNYVGVDIYNNGAEGTNNGHKGKDLKWQKQYLEEMMNKMKCKLQ